MSSTLAITLIVLILIGDILAFTKFKDIFTYEVEEYYLIDEKGKVIKKL